MLDYSLWEDILAYTCHHQLVYINTQTEVTNGQPEKVRKSFEDQKRENRNFNLPLGNWNLSGN